MLQQLQINRVKFLCIDSILLMPFYKKSDKTWVLYSSFGRRYILNSFVRIVAELVLNFFIFDRMKLVQHYINNYFICSI